MIKVAVVGYGNIGKAALGAINSSADMKLVGVIRSSGKGAEHYKELIGVQVVKTVQELSEKPDVVLLCTPTRNVKEQAIVYLSQGIHTVDSFDIHSEIYQLTNELDKIAKENNAVSVVSAGWDPGSDSVVRALFQAIAPKGITYTNFGPGMSMGHSVVAKGKTGVVDALSMTIPTGQGVHRRMVYIQLQDGADFEKAKQEILSDDYFSHDETHVFEVEDVSQLTDCGHGVHMVRKGVSGETHNQLFEFSMQINNPALTAAVMTAFARATMKQTPGAYTTIEIPVIDLLAGDRENLIKSLV